MVRSGISRRPEFRVTYETCSASSHQIRHCGEVPSGRLITASIQKPQ